MEVTSPGAGFIQKIKARQVGIASQHAGAGRAAKGDAIDMTAGIYLHKKVGDAALEGETLATVFANDEQKAAAAAEELLSAYQIGEEMLQTNKLIKEIIGL